MVEKIKIVLPDTGPLITLAQANALEVLLVFDPEQVQLVVTDMVEFEAARHRSAREDAQRIAGFVEKHAGWIVVQKTAFGQMAISAGDADGFVFFVMAALFYVLALVPTALSTKAQPRPLVESSLDLPSLMRNSPLAVAGAFLIGISNSAFGTLGVVFGQAIHLQVSAIALMMSISLVAGSLFQVPVGVMSERRDRRMVLVGLAVLAAAVDIYFIAFQPTQSWPVLIAAALFGGAIYSMYPVLIAHAYDHATPESFLRISGGLLLVFGIGAIIGPLVAGVAMAYSPGRGLFMVTLAAHLALAAYSIYRMTQRIAVADEAKTGFVGMGQARLSTPESGALDPRVDGGGPALNDDLE